MKTKPDLSFMKLWNLSFGFFGVQIAYALQSSQVSRIFSTIGADPHDLSYFWILPPLMGLIVQPIIGTASDRTWNRFGRRLPYLILGAAIAIIVMCFLPNAGSLGLTVSSAIIFGLIMLMLLDTSINMAMQPFKMLVGDMVNEKQKGLAYSIQSFLCNAGSVVGYIAPIILALFLSNTAPTGQVPPTVTVAFYLGAAILLLCVVYTFAKVKEMPPAEYAEYNGAPEESESKGNFFVSMAKLLVHAPKVFWTVGLVQFFCWAAFLYMWSYSTDAIAGSAFKAPSVNKVASIQINGQSYGDKYIFAGDKLIVDDGKLTIAGINVDGEVVAAQTVTNANGDTIVAEGQIFYKEGLAIAAPGEAFANAGQTINVDGQAITVNDAASTVTALSQVTTDDKLTSAHIAKLVNGEYETEQVEDIPAANGADINIVYDTVLNAQSKEYQEAGNWNGILLAVQGLVAVLWALVLPRFRNRKMAYSLSLLIGAIGFISIFFIADKWLLLVSYGIVGCAWAAMLAMPFTILTNALTGGNIGAYLGLFNCTICVPQIIAALCGGFLLALAPVAEGQAPQTIFMLLCSGILLILGALAVWNIKETSGEAARNKQ